MFKECEKCWRFYEIYLLNVQVIYQIHYQLSEEKLQEIITFFRMVCCFLKRGYLHTFFLRGLSTFGMLIKETIKLYLFALQKVVISN